MSGRVIIVGDIHGCLAELRALLGELRLDASDRLVTVGDLVGKGPDGAGVVRFFRQGGHEAVLGNHDAELLDWRAGRRRGRLPPSHRRHAKAMSQQDWDWLAALPLWLELPELGVIVVHAGLVPGVALEDQRPRDLMSMRSLRGDGTASTRVDDGEPWAGRWNGPARVVFGHDALRGLQRWRHAIGLDTGCCYGGRLAALVLPEDRVVFQRAVAVHHPAQMGAVRVCQVAELRAPRAISSGHDEEGRIREVIVVATSSGEPRAYVNRCKHLPIPLDGGGRSFLSDDGAHLMCGTHGALYRLEDGYCVEGPCEGDSLERVPLRVEADGTVVLIP